VIFLVNQKISLGTDLIKLNGPSFNDLESLKIKNLTKNRIIDYRDLKKAFNTKRLIIAQIFNDIYIFRTDKELSKTKMIKIVEENLLKKEQITDFSNGKYPITYENLKFKNNLTNTNIMLYILKEMFLNTLTRNLNEQMIIDYKSNKIIINKKEHDFNGFIFKFEIDENSNVYLKVDTIYPSDFKELKITRDLPKSRERKEDNDNILKFLKEFNFFCGGKTYKLYPNFLNFEKTIIEREC